MHHLLISYLFQEDRCLHAIIGWDRINLTPDGKYYGPCTPQTPIPPTPPDPNPTLNVDDPGMSAMFNFTATTPPVDLLALFNCFNLISNAGATYSVKICAEVPDQSRPQALVTGLGTPGHTFITMTKTNGSESVTQSFGFYPTSGWLSLDMQPQDPKICNINCITTK